MFEIHFNHDTRQEIFRAVTIYAFKLYSSEKKMGKEDEKYMSAICDLRLKNSRHIKWKTKCNVKNLSKNIFLSLPYCNAVIDFKGNDIEVERKIIGDPLSVDHTSVIHQMVYIRTRKSMNLLLEFIGEAMDFYNTKVLDLDNNEKEVCCWLFDEDYWEKLNSQSRRSVDTIYIEKNKKDKIVNGIKHFLNKKTKKRYSELGIRYKRNIILSGFPGTGKSSLAFAIASKFGMNGLTQSLAKELGGKGIRVNALCPVLIPTNGLIEALKGPFSPANDDPEGFYKAKIESGKYYMLKILPETGSLMSSILSGAKSYNDFDDKFFKLGFKI